MKKFLVCLGTWTNSEDKKSLLSQNLKQLSLDEFDFGITTHYPIFNHEEFPKCKFFIFDAHNEFTCLDSPLFELGFCRIPPSSYSSYVDCHNLRFTSRRGFGPHSYPILKAITSAAFMAHSQNYEFMMYCESDLVWTEEVSYKVREIQKQIEEKNLDFYFFESYTAIGTINANVFFIKPEFLLRFLNSTKLQSLQSFHLNFPNQNVEDCLYNLRLYSHLGEIKKREEINKLFGEIGIGWDISQIGANWIHEISETSVAVNILNRPYLQRVGNHFNLGFLKAINWLQTEAELFARIDKVDNQGERQTLFEKSDFLTANTFRYWKDLSLVREENGNHLEITTRTKCGEIEIEENYRLNLIFKEILGYFNLFEFTENI